MYEEMYPFSQTLVDDGLQHWTEPVLSHRSEEALTVDDQSDDEGSAVVRLVTCH